MSNSIVSEKIKLVRESFNMSMPKFASRVGVSKNTVYRWEKGKFMPEKQQLEKIAQAFEMPADWFFADAETVPFNAVIKGELPIKNNCSMITVDDSVSSGKISIMGAKIKYLRKNNEMSQSEFADKIGVHKNTVYYWEKEIHIPTENQLEKIVEVFDLPADWILIDTENDLINAVGERIKYVRESNDMSHVKFSAKIGVDKKTVPQWERGSFIPTKAKLLKIAELFNVSIDWLRFGIGTEKDEFKGERTDFKAVEIKELPVPNLKENKPATITAHECIDTETKYLLTLFTTLSPARQGRLLGYLDALCREEMINEKMLTG